MGGGGGPRSFNSSEVSRGRIRAVPSRVVRTSAPPLFNRFTWKNSAAATRVNRSFRGACARVRARANESVRPLLSSLSLPPSLLPHRAPLSARSRPAIFQLSTARREEREREEAEEVEGVLRGNRICGAVERYETQARKAERRVTKCPRLGGPMVNTKEAEGIIKQEVQGYFVNYDPLHFIIGLFYRESGTLASCYHVKNNGHNRTL